jgi:hypothetical protein
MYVGLARFRFSPCALLLGRAGEIFFDHSPEAGANVSEPRLSRWKFKPA